MPLTDMAVGLHSQHGPLSLHQCGWAFHSQHGPFMQASSYLNDNLYYCKSILVTSTIFQLSQLHVCGSIYTHQEVQGMFPNKQEDLEIKMLRSFSFN